MALLQLGLIGRGIQHSKSPTLFAQKSTLGRTVSYRLFEVASTDGLPNLLAHTPEVQGYNVTVPYKQAIVSLCTQLVGAAQTLQAVNTIWRPPHEPDQLMGYNTDVLGLAATFKGWLPQQLGGTALILGTGGAARAVHYALQEHPFESVCFVSRSPHRARIDHARVIDYKEAADRLPEARLLVNATPLGTWPHVEAMPPLALAGLSPSTYVLDLIYNPQKTRLLHTAEAAGCPIQNGWGMLKEQAEASWRIWTQAG